MWRAVGAEFRKLAHPVALIMVVVCFAFIWADARTTYHFARLQTPVAVIASSDLAAAASQCSSSQSTSVVTPECQQRLADAALNDHFAQNGIALGRVTNALSTWPGLLRFVAHQLATGLGWVLLAILLSIHVAGEWSSKTAGNTLLAVGGLRSFWLAKVASIWLAMVGLAVVGTTVLYLIKPTFTAAVGIPQPLQQEGDPSTWHLAALPPDAAWSSWSLSFGVLAVASLIWLILSMAGAALGVLLRRPILMAVIGVACLSAGVVVARWVHRPEWTYLSAIGQLLRLDRTPFGVRDTRMWYVPGAQGFIQQPQVPVPFSAGQVSLWIAIGVVAAGGCWLLARRRPVVG
ncbi:MAG: hypothetical protein ACJ74U_10855 [Jatrophihabitantaceae bacterium]